jgi:hypothetical protein
MEERARMSLKGTTALIRLAQNPRCELLGAMVMQEGTEKRFYERVAGAPYDREYGERQSSKRRGAQFEQNAYAGDGRLLREALAPMIGVAPDQVRVRNLLDDHPGTKEDARVARLRVTRQILAASMKGQTFPHILIQPQLLIPTDPGPRPYFFVSPDLLVWSAQDRLYVPGDLKSFVVRENEVAKGDLARVRLQLAANSLGLAHEYCRIDREIVVPPRALLIFSKPNGLRPHNPRIEDIGGAVDAVRIGIAAFLRHRARIDALRAGADPYTVAAELVPHFEEACLASCVMAPWCRERVAGHTADLGDAARDTLGDIQLARLTGLMLGTIEPADDHERAVATELQRLTNLHGRARVA